MKSVNQVASNVQVKLDRRRKERVLPVLDVVRDAIVRGRKVLYGGMAMNLYLPHKARFYDPDALPDYDVYSNSAKAFVVRLADRLRRLGYDHVEVRCALHPGTYKLSWDSESLLDVTEVSGSEMRTLRSKSRRTPEGFLLCPLSYLKAQAYLELASPDTAAFRWSKVYKRVRLLETYLRAPTHVKPAVQGPVQDPVQDPDTFVTTGLDAAYHYLGGGKHETRFDGKNPQILGNIKDFPKDHKIKQIYPHFFQVYVRKGRSWVPTIRVHDVSEQCVSFDPNAPRFASLFHVMYVGYMEHYRFGTTTIPLRRLLPLSNESRFHSECVGTARTVQNLKRAQSDWTY